MEKYLKCNFCKQDYNLIKKNPRMLKNCGHSICEECLQEYIKLQIPIKCEEDNNIIKIEKKELNYFPKNFALLQIIQNSEMDKNEKEKKKESSISEKNKEEKSASILTDKKQIGKKTNSNQSWKSLKIKKTEICKEHEKKTEIICINCSQRICYQCGLFGKHRNHKIIDYSKFLSEINSYKIEIMKKKKILENKEDFLKGKFLSDYLIVPSKKKYKELVSEIFSIFADFLRILKNSKKSVIFRLEEVFENTEENLKKKIHEELKNKNSEFLRVKKDIIYQLNKLKEGKKDERIYCEIIKEKENLKIIEKADKVILALKKKTKFWKNNIASFFKNFSVFLKKKALTNIVDFDFEKLNFEKNFDLLNKSDFCFEDSLESFDKNELSFDSKKNKLKNDFSGESHKNSFEEYSKKNSFEQNSKNYSKRNSFIENSNTFEKNLQIKFKKNLSKESKKSENGNSFNNFSSNIEDFSNIDFSLKNKKNNRKNNFHDFQDLKEDSINQNSFNDYNYKQKSFEEKKDRNICFFENRLKKNEKFKIEKKGSLKEFKKKKKKKLNRKNTVFSSFFEKNKKDLNGLKNFDFLEKKTVPKISDIFENNKELNFGVNKEKFGTKSYRHSLAISSERNMDFFTKENDKNDSNFRMNFREKKNNYTERVRNNTYYDKNDINKYNLNHEKDNFPIIKNEKSQKNQKLIKTNKSKIDLFKGKLKNSFKVDLSNINFEKEDSVSNLTKFLTTAKNIKILILKNNKLTDSDLIQICDGLIYSKIKTLDLSGNKFTLNSVNFLTGLVNKNKFIKNIIFKNNVKREKYFLKVINEFKKSDVHFLI